MPEHTKAYTETELEIESQLWFRQCCKTELIHNLTSLQINLETGDRGLIVRNCVVMSVLQVVSPYTLDDTLASLFATFRGHEIFELLHMLYRRCYAYP